MSTVSTNVDIYHETGWYKVGTAKININYTINNQKFNVSSIQFSDFTWNTYYDSSSYQTVSYEPSTGTVYYGQSSRILLQKNGSTILEILPKYTNDYTHYRYNYKQNDNKIIISGGTIQTAESGVISSGDYTIKFDTDNGTSEKRFWMSGNGYDQVLIIQSANNTINLSLTIDGGDSGGGGSGGGNTGGGDSGGGDTGDLSNIGRQHTIISENSNKKDFSTLYNFLQNTLSNHYEINSATENKDSTTLFAKNIKTLYDSNKNKTFPQNNIITKTNHADSTVNIIAQFKNGLSLKDQFSIINALDPYNNVISALAQDTAENPTHCQGQCVGFCSNTCGADCVNSCIGNTQVGTSFLGLACSSCSSDCMEACGTSCSTLCVGCKSGCYTGCKLTCAGISVVLV